MPGNASRGGCPAAEGGSTAEWYAREVRHGTPMTVRPSLLLTLAAVLTPALLGCSAPLTSNSPPPGLEFPAEGDQPAVVSAADESAVDESAGSVDGEAVETILRAVDGDTFELSVSGTVRLVGIDSPESVKPNSPVECHGKNASAAASRLTGMRARLETDEVAGETDRYGRRLAYLWYLDEGTWKLYNLEAVANGDARAYAYQDQPYAYRDEFEAAEADASARRLGLWSCD